MTRTARVERETSETKLVVELDLEAVRRFRAAVPVVENAREL